MGEGGGQVLRSALTLSILSVTAFFNPPYPRQAPEARLDGAAPQSCRRRGCHQPRRVWKGPTWDHTTLNFIPGQIRSGRYQFDIGTAGATSLVLQTIAIPLSFAGSASSVIITGGTHVPWSPSFHYLDLQWRYWMSSMGFDLTLTLDQAGFYPQGGGRISCVIRPAQPTQPPPAQRGALVRLSGISAVAELDPSDCRPPKTPGYWVAWASASLLCW